MKHLFPNERNPFPSSEDTEAGGQFFNELFKRVRLVRIPMTWRRKGGSEELLTAFGGSWWTSSGNEIGLNKLVQSKALAPRDHTGTGYAHDKEVERPQTEKD